jgi:S-DNA-T family DNA segregation ATPase FtsK/SpoIIIE
VAGLSIFDPVFLGLDEDGQHVTIELVYRNILIGGEPGSGKSVGLNDLVAHAALSPDVRL